MAQAGTGAVFAAHRAQQQQAADTVVGITAARRRQTPWSPRLEHSRRVGVALSELGTPYVWGGAGPAASTAPASSCGPSRRSAFAAPLDLRALRHGCPVSQDQLQPGDLVFFDGLGHVGIYIGGGQFVHAPHTGDVVKVSSLYEGWYASTTSAPAGSSSGQSA